MVFKMVASKLLGVVGIFLMANYAAVNGRCLKPCPPTWSKWQDKCYKVHDSYVSWEEGKQICVEMDGVMVVTQSEEEIQHLLNLCSCDKFRIGCNDIDVEGTWMCLIGEGTNDVNDERWIDGKPNNYHNHDCAMAGASGWNDGDCNTARTVICQRPVSPVL